jgi:hypothetical protein
VVSTCCRIPDLKWDLAVLAGTVNAAQETYMNGPFGFGALLENHGQPRFVPIMCESLYCSMSILLTAVDRLWLSGYVDNKDLMKHAQVSNPACKTAIGAINNFLGSAVSISVPLNAA